MSNPSGESPRPSYEEQKDYLTQQQLHISNFLFECGVVSRLVINHKHDAGKRLNLEDTGQLDHIFVPSLARKAVGAKMEQELSLVAITPGDSPAYTYFKLGTIDSAQILFTYTDYSQSEQDKDDAWAVHAQAQDLVAARELGILPDLESDLLSIHNPNTDIRRVPYKQV